MLFPQGISESWGISPVFCEIGYTDFISPVFPFISRTSFTQKLRVFVTTTGIFLSRAMMAR